MSADGPIVEEVRQRRHEISERFGHDLKAYAEHLKRVEEKYRDQVVSQITVVPSTPRQPSPPRA
ncbi:MAG: hypothetical protein C4547_13460 [Phycisphaerales bacterium]|nr:MAG: hypothetical protein C4547_13460 [Phycisphaerales bacterium]